MLLRERVRMLLRLSHSSDEAGKGCTDFASRYVFIVFYCIRFYHVRLFAFRV